MDRATNEINEIDGLNKISSPYRRLSPLSKLFMTSVFIFATASFNKYDIYAVAFMALFPIIGYQFSFIPIKTCFYKMRFVIPLVCAVGLFNPFFDKSAFLKIGPVIITGGVISMITLMLKGVFSLAASFLLIATTPIEEICAGLRKIHFPKTLNILLLLTYRYISLMLDEAGTVWQAYSLRAPGQRGVNFRAWGSFPGRLILRGSDRAGDLYESMTLRGFDGEFRLGEEHKFSRISPLIAVTVAAAAVLSRIYNIPSLLGNLIMK